MTDPLPPLPERETLRLHQANERTQLAWVRTALAMMGFGFVVARFGLFLRELAAARGTPVPPGAPGSLWAGIALAALGVVTVLASMIRFRSTAAAIERHDVGAPTGTAWIYGVGVALVVIGVAIGILLVGAR